MRRILTFLLTIIFLLEQSSCSYEFDKHENKSLDSKIIKQIVRSQFCTLAKVRGLDKRIFSGETDSSSWSYALTRGFSGRENRDSTVEYIKNYLVNNRLSATGISTVSIFNPVLISLPRSVKFNVCNKYHIVTVYGKNDSVHQKAGLLATAQPVVINDSLRLYYYEFGRYPLVSAGFSVLKVTRDSEVKPVYERELWISCGPSD